MNSAPRNTPEAPPPPLPIVLPRRPDRWTPSNIQIHASIIPNSVFTWAEATHGGTRMPPDQETVDAIVRIAQLAQQARDRIGRVPFMSPVGTVPQISMLASVGFQTAVIL
uniref:Uncharacterized protein n=1 Tax=Desertifilum tharense IPPAS B-1220 TaxID=1781255 RepID=A0ACD5GRH6_9CYAN